MFYDFCQICNVDLQNFTKSNFLSKSQPQIKPSISNIYVSQFLPLSNLITLF